MPEHHDPGHLPEKVLQFGTGILLRGLPDYFIDHANKQGIFNGRVVVVKSTPGSAEDFQKENGRFITCVRGIEHGTKIEDTFVNTSISRVLTARSQWPEILEVACSPDLKVIISNTTEVGIKLEPEFIFQSPPASFPAKLTATLYARFKKLGRNSDELVVLPTELVPDNGKKLRVIMLQQIEHNRLERSFVEWLEEKVLFCNSLVDRIVTRPSESVSCSIEGMNSLAIQAEPYKLWAIEGGKKVKDICSFAGADNGVIIEEDIEYYRERKIRLLNGTHTISVCLGFLKGFDTVFECMQDPEMSSFVERAMVSEILPTLSTGTQSQNKQFAVDVLDRFRNPYTAHRLLSITLQATAKMKMRNVPTLLRYGQILSKAPDLLARGFSAYLLFMRARTNDGSQYAGVRNGIPYPIQDDQAAFFYNAWSAVVSGDPGSVRNFVTDVLRNTILWDHDLTQLPGFNDAVTIHLEDLMTLTTA